LSLCALLIASLTSLVGAGAASAGASLRPPRTPTWQLMDYQQQGCFSPNVHDTYFGIWISGQWRSSINVGAGGLPAGGAYDTSYAPIPPGSSTGQYSLAYVHVMFSTTPPIGVYTASLWASDGRTTQQVPVTINVVSRCGY
jgi:hypothetical protein